MLVLPGWTLIGFALWIGTVLMCVLISGAEKPEIESQRWGKGSPEEGIRDGWVKDGLDDL